ncbi:A/G-specific adenine glycosylase [Corynebacterium sp. TAE3-ERU2]|uniref:A/G-specific adenine glycosylase n=1 Tax=Corynebacterium sp. TAE3-ERU2 TaxID=2849497 RepID=UPI001C48C496|nr:A/G-specific adenine glycosylase [Corynebacterium sp. TAE3-ERU2]MBV7301591.1 A/G-specific adenine glycosylase [Corynebacterium sp. TAE3-ERU2]
MFNSAALLTWFTAHRRPLLWRAPGTSAWGVLVSEVMSQQTPVARVEPQWEAWMRRWPTPQDVAQASTADILTAWDRLGYPRRALRLKECAQAITDRHHGEVPDDLAALLDLPGIGDYTARAVLAFHYRRRVPVVDTNVRRVISRAVHGRYLPRPARKKDLADVEALLPAGTDAAAEERAAELSTAIMELGALVCTASSPRCTECPLLNSCRWQLAGCPEPSAAELAASKKRVQKFQGTDRQVRGKIMALARAHKQVERAEIDAVWEDKAQLARALFSLLDDGLLEAVADDHFALPR